mmetsp:Transcript_3717/g.15473  ORF Transcript_3717/g.15473 Transcript_3717/m.15473 type:complete len:207 (+) Transcript_3717:400-1020(+)
MPRRSEKSLDDVIGHSESQQRTKGSNANALRCRAGVGRRRAKPLPQAPDALLRQQRPVATTARPQISRTCTDSSRRRPGQGCYAVGDEGRKPLEPPVPPQRIAPPGRAGAARGRPGRGAVGAHRRPADESFRICGLVVGKRQLAQVSLGGFVRSFRVVSRVGGEKPLPEGGGGNPPVGACEGGSEDGGGVLRRAKQHGHASVPFAS